MTKRKIFHTIVAFLSSMLVFGGAACNNSASTTEETSETQMAVVEGEYIYRGGISEYSILIRDDANVYEQFASTELANNLGAATGHSIAVVTESELKDDKRVISLGHTSLWDEKVKLTLSSKDIVDSGYYIKTVENNIYISCPDFTTSSGVLYGVYDLLGDLINYEFYAADEIAYDKKTDIPLYDYAGTIVNPSFELRMLPNADLRDDRTSTMRYRLIHPNTSFGMVTWGHGQVHQYVIPEDACTCGEAGCGNGITRLEHHPEWYSEYGTKNVQLCWGAGELLEQETAKAFIKFFQTYPDATYFMFGQEDNVGYCKCDNCLALMEEYACNSAGLQIMFMNNVIELTSAWLAENQPGRQVKYIVYSYYATETAPVKKTADGQIVPYSDKVIPADDLYIFYAPIGANFAFQIDEQTNADVYKNLTEWNVIADGQIIMYLYDINFRQYLINFNNFGTAKGMYETCLDFGVSCISSQAADSYTSCFQYMRQYVEGKLMWNVDQSYDELVREFMAAYYKDAANDIYEYYKIMRDRYAYYQNVVSPESGGIYGDILNTTLWPQSVVEKMDTAFERALASIAKYQDSDPALYSKLKDRIMKERLSVLYLKYSLHSDYYSESQILEIREELKYYINYFKLSELKEGSGFGDLFG